MSSPRVAIVGAGFGGIATAIALRQAGVQRVELYERAEHLGGVWWFNDYPGAACDIPSAMYSYSYAQRKDWSRPCPSRDEVLGYMADVAREHRVDEQIRLNTEITAARFDETTMAWTLESADGATFEADVLVLACGQLSRPAIPNVPGRETFGGQQFHSAEWPAGEDLAGKRVAVVGTGATAVQVIPAIAEAAARVDVVQRSAAWMLPRQNEDYSPFTLSLIKRVPGLQWARRRFLQTFGVAVTAGLVRNPRFNLPWQLWSAAYLRLRVKDPVLRAKLRPRDPFGCKRMLFSSKYYETVQRPDVALLTQGIDRVTKTGIAYADGIERDVDTIVWATGFQDALVAPMDVTGRDGQRLADTWAGGEVAHHGITVHGFPNAFLLYGPNTNLGSGSIIEMLEAQASYIVQAVGMLPADGGYAIEVTAAAQELSNAALDHEMRSTVWNGCDSWYRKDHTGRITRNWPMSVREYVETVAVPARHDFALLRPSHDAHPAPVVPPPSRTAA
ncbi:MAG: NAD(P)/FAD-dependent oxidoreductase [Solirubrobacteraceae bacterium]|nr:NAD(P)/FAD-dependent oxidoreductase [Solirubrobacteraceae bacterium]